MVLKKYVAGQIAIAFVLEEPGHLGQQIRDPRRVEVAVVNALVPLLVLFLTIQLIKPWLLTAKLHNTLNLKKM